MLKATWKGWKRGVQGRLFLLLLGGLLGVCLVEAVLTLTDSSRGLGFNHPPDHTWGNVVRHNRFDFREREFTSPKPVGVYRIMVLGDSLTWGAGLAVEQRYTNLVEEYLTRRFPRRRVEVLNFGLPAAPTTRERDILLEYKDSVEPDLIVLGFCLNDPQPKNQNYSVERERFEWRYGRRIKAVSQRLARVGLGRVGKLLDNAAYGFAEVAGIIPTWEVALQRTYEKNSKEWGDFEKALRDIKAISDGMKLPPPIFAILNQGTSATRPTDYEHPDEELKLWLRWYHQAEEAAATAGLVTYTHEKEIASELSGELLAVNVADGHSSAKLNQVYAKKLFDVIEAQMVGRQNGG